MENLIRKATDNTLGVCFDAETGALEMEGASYPENAARFFKPLEDWLETFIDNLGIPVVLNLKLNYLNSTSTKHLLDFLEILEEYHENSGNVRVNWYFEESEYNIQEMGEDFAEDMNLPIELITY